MPQERKIYQRFELRRIEGDVGIEVEMEGNGLPLDIPLYWMPVRDPSLRGPSMEYVLNSPVDAGQVDQVVTYLYEKFNQPPCKIKPSSRCGVHVHINMQKATEMETLTFVLLYLILENILVEWCGEDRVGNMFCLRLRDAEVLTEQLIRVALYGSWREVDMTNRYRYASLNVTALRKYGSLEFRALATPDKPDRILQWVAILWQLKQAAKDFSTPTALVEGMSAIGGEAFIRMVLGELADLVIQEDMPIDDMLYEGVRLVQDVAYTQPAIKERPKPPIFEVDEDEDDDGFDEVDPFEVIED